MLDTVKLTLDINNTEKNARERESKCGEVEGAETQPGKTWEDDQEPS